MRDGVHLRAAEKPHEVVFQRKVELGHAGVALTAGTAAQLIVDAAGLVALGADDAESPGGEHLFLLRVADLAGAGEGVGAVGGRWDGAARLLVALLGLHVEPALAQQVLGEHVRLATQTDVGTAAGHVGGDGDGAEAPGLGHDMRLALVVLGVQRLVLDASLVQKPRELLGVLDGHGADQARLALRVARGDVVGHGVELAVDGAVHQIVLVDADDRPIGRNGHDRQLVDLAELRVLGHGGTGHAGELVVEAEVVLQRDGGQRLVLLAHEHVLFGLERLVQALGVAASLHDAAGELVDDLHLAVHDDVVHVAMEEELGLQRLLQVVRQLAGRVGVDVLDAEHDLDLLKAALRGVDGALGLVHVEVDALL